MRICPRWLCRHRLRPELLEERRLLTAVPLAAPVATPPSATDYAPALYGPNTLNVVQGATLALNGANLITDSDVDAGTTVETVSLAVNGGTLSLGADYGRVIAGASGTSQITISGTLPQLNDTLANLSYQAPISGSSFALTAVANDGVLSSVPLVAAITVLPDQAPVVHGPIGVTVTQGASLPLNTANLLSITDVDAGTRVETLSLAVTGGTLTYNANYGTLIGGANGTSSVTVSGTLAQLNGALASLSYQAPASGQIYNLTASVDDGVLSSAVWNVPIFILPDQPPIVTGPAAVGVTQGMSLPLNGADLISVAHVGTGTNPETVTVSVTGGALSFNTNYAKLVAGASGSSQLTFSGSLLQLNAALASLTYKAPIAGSQFTLTATANDGVLNSSPLNTTITLLADKAPIVTGPSTVTAYQGMILPLDGPNLITLASQNPPNNVESLTLSVTAGTLSVSTVYGSVLNGSNGTSLLTLSGTVPQLNQTLATLSYKAPLTLSTYTLAAVANDGVLNSAPWFTGITIARDAGPSVSGPSSFNVTQGATVSLNGPDLITVADPDIGTGLGSISLSVGAGTLSYTSNYATLIAGANGTSQLTLSGTIAQLNSALATLTYKAPAAGSGVFTSLVAVANDGVVSSTPLSTVIDLGADQAPMVAGPPSLSLSQGEMIPLAGADAITVSHNGMAPTIETITLSVSGGTLSYTSNYGTLVGGANNSGLITLSGTLAQLNTALATLSYKAPPTGRQFTLTAVANDGVLSSAPLTVPINIPDPWQNQANHLDVENNGVISPADALIIINYLNSHPNAVLPPISQPPPFYLDVNGTGIVTPLDALEIIDYLNGDPLPLAVPPASSAAASAAPSTSSAASGNSLANSSPSASVDPATVAPSAVAASASSAAAVVRQEPPAPTISATPSADVSPAVVDAALADLGPEWIPPSDEQG